MRVFLCLAVLAIATPARADSFLELAGGISIPLGDDEWTNLVESSPKLALRAGAVPKQLGFVVSADWTPVNTDAGSWSVPGASGDVSAHRFRILVGPMIRHAVSNTLSVTATAGIGADIAHASAEATVLGANFESSETDVGLGFEVGGGVWFKVGGVEVGGQVAVPFGIHDDDNDTLDFSYTSYDFEILGGVRFWQN